MSCSWSPPTRFLATKTSKLEKNEVPGGANTNPSKPRGNSATVVLFSVLTAGPDEDAEDIMAGSDSIALPVPRPPEPLPVPTTDGGGCAICESPPDNDPKRPPEPELP